MVTVENKEILLPEKEAKKKAAYLKTDSVYAGNKLQFKVNKLIGKKFRLVHNDINVYALIDGTEKSKTTTIFKAEDFKTEQEAFDRIEKLGLEYETEALVTELKTIGFEL